MQRSLLCSARPDQLAEELGGHLTEDADVRFGVETHRRAEESANEAEQAAEDGDCRRDDV